MSAGPTEELCILCDCSNGYRNAWMATISLRWQYGMYIWMQALYVEPIGHGDDGISLAMVCICLDTIASNSPLISVVR